MEVGVIDSAGICGNVYSFVRFVYSWVLFPLSSPLDLLSSCQYEEEEEKKHKDKPAG